MSDDRSTRNAEDDEFVQRALRQNLAFLVDELHDAIEEGLDEETLHSIVGLWEANNINEQTTYEMLVKQGKPTPCDDCATDVTPYDEDGRATEGGWEWYMVDDEIWQAAGRGDPEPRYLCIGCLEDRIGRRLVPDDFSDYGVNEVHGLTTKRLRARHGVIEEAADDSR